MRRTRAPLVTLALVLAGCGTVSDRDQARDVVTRFYAALAADRPTVACAQLSGPALQALESQSGRACRAVITRLDYEDEQASVVAASVFATNAKVDVDSGESAFLSREARAWRISALACRPGGEGSPRDRPYDCEVES